MFQIQFKLNGQCLLHYYIEGTLQEVIIEANRRFNQSYYSKECASGYVYSLEDNGIKTYVGRF